MKNKFTHCYSNYVEHILNNSPSKTTYTFPKEERFVPSNNQKKAPVDDVMEKVFTHSSNKYLAQDTKQKPILAKSRDKKVNNFLDKKQNTQKTHAKKTFHVQGEAQKSRQKSKNKKRSNSSLQRSPNQSILKNNRNRRNQKSKSAKRLKYADEIAHKQTGHKRISSQFMVDNNKLTQINKNHRQSPFKTVNFDSLKEYDQNLKYLQMHNQMQYESNRYIKYSPYYRDFLAKSKDRKQKYAEQLRKLRRSSSSKSNKWRSKSKSLKKLDTPTLVMQQIDYPAKNITNKGYYPVGKEISPDGKYSISTYKNIISHSFGNPPPKSQKKSVSPGYKADSPAKTKKLEQRVFKSDNRKDLRQPEYNHRLHNQKNRYEPSPQYNKHSANMVSTSPYPDLGYYHRHLIDKKAEKREKNKNATMSYTPFSQFGGAGYVNQFKY